MKNLKLEIYSLALKAKQTELAGSHRSVDGIAVERTPDSMDEVILANERDLALRSLTREACMCRLVSAALERLAAGTFGSCLQCGEPISDRRLRALPWAALCLECQEAADNAQGLEKDGLDWPVSAVA
jgi:DnaK suppressor protein